jgi:hypothetical protein
MAARQYANRESKCPGKHRRRSRTLWLENDGHGENHGEELPEIHFHTLQFLAEYAPPCTGSTATNAGATQRSTERPLGASASLEIKAKSYPVRHSTSPVLAVAAGTQTPTRSLARCRCYWLVVAAEGGGRRRGVARRSFEVGCLPFLRSLLPLSSVRLRITDRRWEL